VIKKHYQSVYMYRYKNDERRNACFDEPEYTRMSIAKKENLTSNNNDTKMLMNKKWDHIFGIRFVTSIDINEISRYLHRYSR